MLPQACPEEDEILFHKVFLTQDQNGIACRSSKLKAYGAEGFYDGKFHRPPFPKHLAVTKEDGFFRIQYSGKQDNGFYGTKMMLRPGEYGRIILNERGTYCDTGIWYYDLITYNFVNAPYSCCRPKLFYRKEADHEFRDMQYLRYSGT